MLLDVSICDPCNSIPTDRRLSHKPVMETVKQLFTWLFVQYTAICIFVKYTSYGNVFLYIITLLV